MAWIESTSMSVISPFPFITMRSRLYEREPETLRVRLLPILEPAGIAIVDGFACRTDTESSTVVIDDRGGL
jgi:hypothetical protein